jgi:hypothetical protein
VHLNNLTKLTHLIMGYCENLTDEGLEKLFTSTMKISLLTMNFMNSIVTHFDNLKNLPLTNLTLIDAKSLESLKGLGGQENLEYLNLSGSTNLRFNSLTNSEKLSNLDPLPLDDLEKLSSLKTLLLNECPCLLYFAIKQLTDKLNKLSHFEFSGLKLDPKEEGYVESVLNQRIEKTKTSQSSQDWPNERTYPLNYSHISVISSSYLNKKNNTLISFGINSFGGLTKSSLFFKVNQWAKNGKSPSVLAIALNIDKTHWAYLLCIRPDVSSIIKQTGKKTICLLIDSRQSIPYKDGLKATLETALGEEPSFQSNSLENKKDCDAGIWVLYALQQTMDKLCEDSISSDENSIKFRNDFIKESKNSIYIAVKRSEYRKVFRNASIKN